MRIVILFLIAVSFALPAQAKKKPSEAQKKATAAQIEKVPKSLFLIKKAKINSAVGEPQYYPSEAQLRTVIYDQNLHNIKKYE